MATSEAKRLCALDGLRWAELSKADREVVEAYARLVRDMRQRAEGRKVASLEEAIIAKARGTGRL